MLDIHLLYVPQIGNHIHNKKTFFKLVYRWNLDTQEPNLIIDDKGNVKVKGEYKKRLLKIEPNLVSTNKNYLLFF